MTKDQLVATGVAVVLGFIGGLTGNLFLQELTVSAGLALPVDITFGLTVWARKQP